MYGPQLFLFLFSVLFFFCSNLTSTVYRFGAFLLFLCPIDRTVVQDHRQKNRWQVALCSHASALLATLRSYWSRHFRLQNVPEWVLGCWGMFRNLNNGERCTVNKVMWTLNPVCVCVRGRATASWFLISLLCLITFFFSTAMIWQFYTLWAKSTFILFLTCKRNNDYA